MKSECSFNRRQLMWESRVTEFKQRALITLADDAAFFCCLSRASWCSDMLNQEALGWSEHHAQNLHKLLQTELYSLCPDWCSEEVLNNGSLLLGCTWIHQRLCMLLISGLLLSHVSVRVRILQVNSSSTFVKWSPRWAQQHRSSTCYRLEPPS